MCVADDYEVVWNGGEGLTTVGAQPNRIVITNHNFTTHTNTQSIDFSGSLSEAMHYWLATTYQRRWMRVLTYSRNASWPYCSLCGRASRFYGRGQRAGLQMRMHFTAYHRGVCQGCYVRWRMARGRWPGLDARRQSGLRRRKQRNHMEVW